MKYKTDIFLATMFSFWFTAALLLYGWSFIIASLSFLFIYGVSKAFNKGGKDYFIKSFCLALGVSVVLVSALYAGLHYFCEFPEEIPHIINNIKDDYIVLILGASIPAALFTGFIHAKFTEKRP